MSPADLAPPLSTPASDGRAALRERMRRSGQWQDHQMAGRRWPVACVSLEITQRCNLDCTLCYLSEASEAVRDLPLEEVLRRIDLIHAHYGPGTDVQVSGGEPTLRQRDELLAIVARLRERGLRASLFTNGIKASRALLTDLARAGLTDVAFHVDTTQQRSGYASEADLNALRLEYIDRARGLPLHVFFNTTVHAGNVAEVPQRYRAVASLMQSDLEKLDDKTLDHIARRPGRQVLCKAPGKNEAAVIVAVGRRKPPRAAPAFNGEWQEHLVLRHHSI